VSPRKIPADVGLEAIHSFLASPESGLSDPDVAGLACRYSLQVLASVAPGRAVEVRVPPYGAVQVIEGPRHTRGTPPAVIEMTPRVWLEVATGVMSWSDAVSAGAVDSSGHRANLQQWLPLAGLG
jgi:hypothetical protein